MVFNKRIAKHVLGFVLLYGLFLCAWIVVQGFYANQLMGIGKYLFGNFRSNGVVIFQPISAQDKMDRALEDHDVTVLFLNEKIMKDLRQQAASQGKTGGFGARLELEKSNLISRTVGYLPTILVAALILASPLSKVRKMKALAAGLLLIHCFIAIKLWIYVLHEFSRREALSVVVLSPFWKNILSQLHYVLFLNIGTTVIVPVFIWILASFRRSDWTSLTAASLSVSEK